MFRKQIVSLLAILCVLFASNFVHAQLVIVNQGATAEVIVNSIISGGLTVSNATINCPTNAYGTFTNGATTCANIESGLILTTGNVNNVGQAAGNINTTNYSESSGTTCADPELLSLESNATYDCCILEFDVVPSCDNLLIRFVFGSDEYPEYAPPEWTLYNDAFGFFVTGSNPTGPNYNNTNVATLPDNTTIVSVNNVNPNSNNAFYIDNNGCTSIVFDGLTTTLIRELEVVPCESYHFKLAISDSGDPLWDSGVFVDFLECEDPLEASVSSSPVTCAGSDGTATVNASGGYPGYTYTWNTTPPQTTATATGLDPGIYEVSVDDAGACTDPIIETVEVVSDAIVPTLTINSETICEGDQVTLTGNASIAGGAFLWSTGENTASINVSPNTTTNYSCDYDLDGCLVSETTTVNVDTTEPGFDVQNACDSYTWIDGQTYTSNNNTATFTIIGGAVNGCDSLVNLNLTIDPLVTPTFEQMGPYCEGELIPDLTLNSIEGIIGSWSPAIDNSQTTIYTFTPDAGQCANPQTMQIIINSEISPNFVQQGPFCEADVIADLPSASNGGITGSWFPTIDNTQTMTYTFTPDAGQCAIPATMEIIIDPLLNATFTQVGPYCQGSPVPDLLTTSSEGITGSWSPVIDNVQTTIYTFTADPGQCVNPQTMEIIIDPIQVTTFDSFGPYCQDDPADPLPNVSPDGITGVWGPPGINTTALGSTIYTFISDPNQCALNYQVEVTVNPIPDIDIDGPIEICEGQEAILTAISGLSNGVYSWQPGGENTNEISINPIESTTYSVIYTVSGCPSPLSEFTLTVNPNIPVFAGDDIEICMGESVTLEGDNAETYSWSDGVENGIPFEPNSSGIYTLTGVSANGCVTEDEVSVIVNSLPIIDPGSPFSVCEGSEVTLTATGAGPGASYTWSNGVVDNVPFSLYETNEYTVIGIDENGCEGSASIVVTGIINPDALFTANPSSGVIPLNVDFQNLSTNATNYTWDFGNGEILNYAEPDAPVISSLYNNEGVYPVILTALNQFCTDTFMVEIIANLVGDPIVFVPNVFTPNQDGTNEQFIIETENVASIELIILNRWGNIMTTIESLDIGWDGTNRSGNEAAEGVYFYKYIAVGDNGQELSGHGFLTLVR
tara:strand:+ start:2879 stop:6274 length:3396 start_codon:yes stop_codon:yes gene_type:complete